MSYARYSREVRLDDLNNVHTFAALATAPGSRVLDLGAADGSVARVLAARGCLVTAVERDPAAVEVLRSLGVTAVHADLETLPDDPWPAGGFDVVLLLDVLEHLVQPGALLARATAWLAPGGRVLLSVPNVAHAAVRLALLQGRFPRSDVGLLDRTHLQFFDEAQLRDLIAAAGLDVLEVLTVDRDLQDTEVDLDTSTLAPEVVAAATADPSSRIYQFFVVARPAGLTRAGNGGLLQAFQERLRATEATYRALETYATTLDAEMHRVREHAESHEARLQQAVADAELQGRALAAARADAAALESMTVRLADAIADRDTLRRQLGERMRETTELTDTVTVLLADVAVQRGFADSLAAQVPRIAARGGEAQVLATLERFEAVAPTPDAAAALAAEALEYRRLQQALAIRALARVDAILRRLPRTRAWLRRAARGLTGRPQPERLSTP